MFRRKHETDITLSCSNLTALNVATAAMKVCFGNDLEISFANIRQDDNQSLDYTVELLANIPLRDMSTTAHAKVIFSLEEYRVVHTRYRAKGLVHILTIGGITVADEGLNLNATKEGFTLLPHSQMMLDELRARLAQWRTDW